MNILRGFTCLVLVAQDDTIFKGLFEGVVEFELHGLVAQIDELQC